MFCWPAVIHNELSIDSFATVKGDRIVTIHKWDSLSQDSILVAWYVYYLT